jgi:ribosomal protein S18 acetylase RimI-like enzyme
MKTPPRKSPPASPTRGPIRLRRVQPGDAAAIVRLNARVFKTASLDARIQRLLGGPPWQRIKGQMLRHELNQNPAGCFVAVAGTTVVGYVTTAINFTASRGWIINLAVAEACQGRGVGRRLIERALVHFRRLGLHHAKIETLDTNETGKHLYPKLGFIEVARQIHYVRPLGHP